MNRLERLKRMRNGTAAALGGRQDFPDPEGRESATPFLYWFSVFLAGSHETEEI
jgi:hypothetical protein